MNICEIFYSIEGEGIEIGRPQVFVRLAGCNIRCQWCDTKYSWDKGNEMTIADLISEIAKYPCKDVSITGGEPLLQNTEVEQLISQLKINGFSTCINTNGTLFDKAIFDEVDLITMDCKCPSSGEASNLQVLEKTQNIYSSKAKFKFVISDENDYAYARQIVESLLNKSSNVVLQPQWSQRYFVKKLAKLILEDNLSVRLILQQHKLIWGEKKGV